MIKSDMIQSKENLFKMILKRYNHVEKNLTN